MDQKQISFNYWDKYCQPRQCFSRFITDTVTVQNAHKGGRLQQYVNFMSYGKSSVNENPKAQPLKMDRLNEKRSKRRKRLMNMAI